MDSINAFSSATLAKLDFPEQQLNNQPINKEPSFMAEFKMALDKINQVQLQASKQAQAFEMGEPNISLNEVMVNMQKSSISLQFGIQFRNKLVAAYQEIMNMNV